MKQQRLLYVTEWLDPLEKDTAEGVVSFGGWLPLPIAATTRKEGRFIANTFRQKNPSDKFRLVTYIPSE